MAEIEKFSAGVHNLEKDENIPQSAAQDARNWYTIDGKLKLIPGRALIGTEGAAGAIYGEIFGYKVNGTKVHWRKAGTKIQYYNGTAWTNVVTGLTATADYTFTNYSSLAGTFTYAWGTDGIYKFHNAHPGSYLSMYSSAINFKGFAFIDKGRSILWGRKEDKTGLYGSKIDPQGANYTTVTNENLASGDGVTVHFSGTLASAGGTKNMFGVSITATGGETFTDNYDGTLTGSAGGTGTINYFTGAWDVTFVTVPANAANNIKANYQYEDSNSGGVTDFRKSATRLAAEGFLVPQDEGGDAIQCVLIGPDGAYYSMKKQSAYRFEIDATDLNPVNEVYRRDIGVPSLRGAVSTGIGIVFINTAKADKPELTILEQNALGDGLNVRVLFPHFKFSNYTFDDATLDTHERYFVIACKSADTSTNDTILLGDNSAKTVDITRYPARTFAKDAGILYCGSPVTETVYKVYDGYDDTGFAIDNYWISKGELFETNRLKKTRRLRLKGHIDPDQSYEVYVSYDDAGYQLVGTVRGDQTYVDYNEAQELGANVIGSAQIGGDNGLNSFPYFLELKLKTPKFRKRTIKFVALGIGYVDIEYLEDFDILTFENKLPRRNRLKQNVSLDGQDTDQDSPTF